jgi:hypothetical protein
MATSVAKVSLSLGQSELEWAQSRAQRDGISLSAVVTEAVRLARQHEARMRVVERLGRAAELTPRREAEILAEWEHTPSRPSNRPYKRPRRRPA